MIVYMINAAVTISPEAVREYAAAHGWVLDPKAMGRELPYILMCHIHDTFKQVQIPVDIDAYGGDIQPAMVEAMRWIAEMQGRPVEVVMIEIGEMDTERSYNARDHLLDLRAQEASLLRLLNSMPQGNVIDRRSVEDRLAAVIRQIVHHGSNQPIDTTGGGGC